MISDFEMTLMIFPMMMLSGKFRQYSTITLGARGDSYYEYLLKQV